MASPTTASAQSGRQIRLGLTGLFLLGALAQFYLAGRGVFGVSSFDAHKAVGNVLQAVSLIILIVTIAVPATRNQTDIGLAAALLVLMIIQGLLGNFDHRQLGAIHPLTGVLVLGAASGILSRDRRLGGVSPSRPG